jgi:hypothetical protein
MATKAEKLELYAQELQNFDSNLDLELLETIVDLLGPSIFNDDSETVACSDKEELERIKESSVIEKLELSPSTEDLEAVCDKMGSSNRNKYRAIFYYLLAK